MMGSIMQTRRHVPDIAYHCGIGLLVRALCVLYGVVQDKFSSLPSYTDIDYAVFCQAAKEVVGQRSPYNVATFRYSPFFAYLMTPCVIEPQLGKMVAALFDTYLAYRIYRLVLLTYNKRQKAVLCAKLWLYNPVAIIVCTRGNLDSVSSVFVLLALLYHLQERPYFSGALLAFSVHLRLYPLIFVPLFVVTADRFSVEDTLKKTYKLKLKFVATCAVSLALITYCFAYVYGHKFIDSSILYHVSRDDIRHNFSLYNYVQLLGTVAPTYVANSFALISPPIMKSLLTAGPMVICLLAVMWKYNTLNHLAFAAFCAAYVFVIFNRVVTCQYYIWYLSLLPVFLPSIVMSKRKVMGVVALWLTGLGSWLLPAYYLEFRGVDTYSYLYAASILNFFINIWILCTFIFAYNSLVAKKTR